MGPHADRDACELRPDPTYVNYRVQKQSLKSDISNV